MPTMHKLALSLALGLVCAPLWSQATDPLDLEQRGEGDQHAPSASAPDPAARANALALLGGGAGLLLIPESTNDRVMAFDAATGDLVDADFIPADVDNLSTPIEAILSADGTAVLVSDQIDDVVQAYDLNTGAFIATFAPAGGANTAILDNVRGIALRPNGNLLVSVGGGANADAIAEFDTAGNSVGNFVANGAAGLVSPFDVHELPNGDFLVPGITSDAVHRYDATGAALANFAALDTFGEQVAEALNGNILVANFSGAQEGIVEFTPAGALVGVYDPASLGGYRGVYELPNGNLLVTNGGGVHEMDRSANVIRTIVPSVSARFITLLGGADQADLALSKTGPADPVAPGVVASFALSVTNNGPDEAISVTVTDTLPAGLSFVGSDCGASAAGQMINWSVGTLAAMATATCNVQVSAAAAGSYSNSAVVTSETEDPDLNNNNASATLLVTSADLAIVKTQLGAVVDKVGTFSLVVSNAGPSDASNVVAIDSFPADLIYLNNDCSASFAAGVLTWNIGTLVAGANATCVVSFALEGVETINTASVSSDTSDPDPNNNSAATVLSRYVSPVPALGQPLQWLLLLLVVGMGAWMASRRTA